MLTASLLEDRRAAAQALKSVSKHYQHEVGTVALQTILTALQRDNEDSESVKCLVETVISICTEGVQLRREFGELFLKDPESARILLGCLQDRSQAVRFSILQLLSILEEMLPHRLAEAILAFPSGLSKLLDLLEDNRDIIRVEAISLLCHLTASSMEIQKIAVFEGTFERMFELIFSEGGVYGGEVIVQDALLIIQNLLWHNPSNQNYFRESPCFQKLAMLLTPAPPTPPSPSTPGASKVEWNPNVTASYREAVEIPCILLHRDNTKLGEVQADLLNIGLFEALINVALNEEAPRPAKTVSLRALGSLMCYNPTAQLKLARHVVTEGRRPTPAILSLIKLAIDDGEADRLSLRMAASDMIGSFLGDNGDGQVVIAATFKSPRQPSSSTPPGLSNHSAGSVLIDRALDLSGVRKDPYRVWFPLAILCHVLRDNSQCKMIALNHQIVPEDGNEDDVESHASFLNVVVQNLVVCIGDPKQLHSSLAYLMLLSTWMHSYPPAVEAFLSRGSNIPFLMELISQHSSAHPLVQGYAAYLFGLLVMFNETRTGSFSRTNLQDIVKSRIGFDVFSARIVRTRDALNTSLLAPQQETKVFDKAFADQYLETYDSILRLFQVPRPGRSSIQHSPAVGSRYVETSVETDAVSDATVSSNLNYFDFEAAVSDGVPLPSADQYQRLIKENARLQRTIDAYAAQLLQVEQDHEELLVCLASYDSELKQLRQHLALAEQQREPDSLQAIPTTSDLTLSHPNGTLPPSSATMEAQRPAAPTLSISSLSREDDTLPTGELYTNTTVPQSSSPPPPSPENTRLTKDTRPLAQVRFGTFLSDANPSTHTFDV